MPGLVILLSVLCILLIARVNALARHINAIKAELAQIKGYLGTAGQQQEKSAAAKSAALTTTAPDAQIKTANDTTAGGSAPIVQGTTFLALKQQFFDWLQPILNSKVVSRSGAVVRRVLGGNPVGKIAAVIALIGLGLLVKYSIDNFTVLPQYRLMCAGVVSLIFLLLGWYIRAINRVVGLLCQGVGAGGFYLTTYAAASVFTLLPLSVAFVMMVIICACTIVLAVAQDAKWLALMTSLGGYLAPILLASDSGSHVTLFSYYLLLSLGIWIVSYFKAWRELNVLGMFFTFGMGAFWGWHYYRQEYFFSAQLFLAVNIVLFGFGCTLNYAQGKLRDTVPWQQTLDAALFFVPALSGFALQGAIARQYPYGVAISALVFAALYLGAAYWLLGKREQTYNVLCKYALALGVGFAAFVVPALLSRQLTALVCVIEAVVLIWAGLMQNSHKLRLTGMAVMLGAMALLPDKALTRLLAWDSTAAAILDKATVFLLAALLIISVEKLFQLYPNDEQQHLFATKTRRAVLLILSVINAVASFMLFSHAADILIDGTRLDIYVTYSAVALLVGSCLFLVFNFIVARLRWKSYLVVSWTIFFFMLAVALLANIGWWWRSQVVVSLVVGYTAYFAAGYFCLFHNRQEFSFFGNRILHGLLAVMLFLTLYHLTLYVDGFWLAAQQNTVHFLVILIYLVLFGLVLKLPVVINNQAFKLQRQLYQLWLPLPLLAILAIFLARGAVLAGQIYQWLYIPLLNPFEIVGYLALLLLCWWLLQLPLQKNIKRLLLLAWLAVAVLWLNLSVLRVVANYAALVWSWPILWNSNLVQAVFSVLWSIVALSTTWLAVRYCHSRKLWWCGMTLLALVLVKLILVDINFTEIWRALSFICVGVLMFILAYLAPLPPKTTAKKGD